MADYESWSPDDQGFRRDDDRNRWRNEGGDWRGSDVPRYGRDDVGRSGRQEDASPHSCL